MFEVFGFYKFIKLSSLKKNRNILENILKEKQVPYTHLKGTHKQRMEDAIGVLESINTPRIK